MANAFAVPLSPGIRQPQDVSLSNLTLLSATGTMDLKNIFIEISYHEDLFNNVSSGYLLLSESMNYNEILHLNGNEFLRLTFSTFGDTNTQIDKLMRVYKMDKRKLEGNMNTISYCLYFCSEEMLLNEQYKLCKSYSKKSISDNVKDILYNFLKVNEGKQQDNTIIEQTYGTYDFIIPTIKPFDAINWMSVYARPSPDKPGADMLLYENKHGFNFRSLQSLMESNVYHNYSYNPKNTNPKNLNESLHNVLTYEVMDAFDTLGAINSGVFANQLISVDILTRTKKTTNFDYGEYQKSSKKLNPYPIVNQYQNRLKDELNQTPQAVLKLVFSNFDEHTSPYIKNQDPNSIAQNIFAETYIPYRTAQIALANYTRLKICVPGDSNLTVGMVIGFSLKSINPNSKEPDAFYSGNYLITAVRHLISDNYKTVLEIVKESTPTQYASPDNNSTIWSNTSKGIK